MPTQKKSMKKDTLPNPPLPTPKNLVKKDTLPNPPLFQVKDCKPLVDIDSTEYGKFIKSAMYKEYEKYVKEEHALIEQGVRELTMNEKKRQ